MTDEDWKLRILEGKLNNLKVEFEALLYFIREIIMLGDENVEDKENIYN